jgi:hypothetical protein
LDVLDVSAEPVRISASDIAEKVKALLGHDDPIVASATGKSVGRVLTRLRVRQDRETTAKRDKLRVITQQEAIGLALAYGLIRHAPSRPGADVSVDVSADSSLLPPPSGETSKTSSAVAVGAPPAAVDDDDGEVF